MLILNIILGVLLAVACVVISDMSNGLKRARADLQFYRKMYVQKGTQKKTATPTTN